MNDFSGEINGFGPIKSVEEWKEQTNKILEKREEPYKVVNSNSFLFFKIFSVILMIGLFVLGGYFLYYINQGKLQSNVNVDQPITINPTVNSTTEIDNEYKHYNTNNNTFSFSFNLDAEMIRRYCNVTNSN
jgi:hypothetical protein